ncbi:pyridoxal kinase [Rhizobium sp. C1]|uniref:pyridoxal kinase n=1 Tax=Rhizobium sp. C1 TaxID=1349799 RepID=UPI001E57B9B6|nr:pyridoxal kinase [Rhizobium sp. C1]MCD2178463.1 pyridoxal kinase [Rhizobium sp. C1]
MRLDQQKSILSISSHVMRGAVGNRAAVFALETRGHSVWSVPTVILPWHPGHGRSTRIAVETEAFAGALSDLKGAKWRGEVRAAMTGYFADAGQVHAAADLIASFKQSDPDFLYLCDPVIGDAGGLYVAEAVAVAIRDALLPLADLATPNRFELGWLAGAPVDDNVAIAAAAARTGVTRVVVTSAHAMMRGAIANLLIEAGRQVLAEHQALERAPNGLGDLFSALFLSHVLGGLPAEEALRLSSSSVFEIAARSIRAGSDELLLQTEAAALKTPMASVAIRSLVSSVSARKRAVLPVPLDKEQAG